MTFLDSPFSLPSPLVQGSNSYPGGYQPASEALKLSPPDGT